MKFEPSRSLNFKLFLLVCVLGGANLIGFSYPVWGPSFWQSWEEYWKVKLNKPAEKAGDRTISDCLQVSDFYSVHLTTYFLQDSADSWGGATDDLKKYAEYCNRVPGTGKVIFAVTLMEKDVRNEAISLSFYRNDAGGEPKLLSSLPPKAYPSGLASMESVVDHRGKYLLRIAFGEAKNKEDVIDVPIMSGE